MDLNRIIYNQLHPFRGCKPTGPGWKKNWSWHFGFSWIFDEKIYERWKDECRLLADDFMSIESWHKKTSTGVKFTEDLKYAFVTLDAGAYLKAKAAHRNSKEQHFIKKYRTLEIKYVSTKS